MFSKYVCHSLVATLAAFLFPVVSIAEGIPGQAAPAFSGVTATGETLSLEDFSGKTLVLEWTNHDCPFVRRHYNGNMQAQQAKAVESDVAWVQVISSAPGKQGYVDGPTAVSLNEDRGAQVTATILDADGSIGRAFKARTTPHMFVIDGEGVVQYAGSIDDKPRGGEGAVQYVPIALAALEQNKTPDPAQTRPYGCSVKY